MDVSTRLPRMGNDILVRGIAPESERRAIGILADWASECMGHDEVVTRDFLAKVRTQVDDNVPVQRIVAEIGTALERAGKPALAGLADLIFAQALIGSSAPSEASFALRRGVMM